MHWLAPSKARSHPRKAIALLLLTPPFLIPFHPATAQIVPDTTLLENSLVLPNGNTVTIEGGTERNVNLFHSFEEFSVPTASEALFNNSPTIQTIFSRITGGNIYNIDELVSANANASLFLLNPNGIVFGPNTRLNIGGSFVASTANRVQFPDRTTFSASNPNSPPLLTINVPVGLQFNSNSGKIQVQGIGNREILPTNSPGLGVTPGNTFALVAGEVSLSGAIITVPSGRIEIGSAKNGVVTAIPTPGGMVLNYDRATELGNIQLRDRTSLFNPAIAENTLAGIQVTGNAIALENAQIAAVTPGIFDSGNITIFASESLSLSGNSPIFPFSSWIVKQVAATATGNSGEIQVNSPAITLTNGSRIQTLSFGAGNAGNLTVNADKIALQGFVIPPTGIPDVSLIDPETFLDRNLNSRIGSEIFARGSGGEITVNAREINFTNGGQITSLVASTSTGNGVNLAITAHSITADNAVVYNPLLTSGAWSYLLGLGNGGHLELSTANISLSNGAQISTWNQGSGRGGELAVNASESIVAQKVNPRSPVFATGIFVSTIATGEAGKLNVSTPRLTLTEGAGLSSIVFAQLLGQPLPNSGRGQRGDVRINADTIVLSGATPLNPGRNRHPITGCKPGVGTG